ncbi:ArsR family transcriptional regulator [Streptomyces sp. NPDC004542]|uniref:MarR family transcriptional regulator n=1 Tax=Streptomyces sp. NPDC004542 TaxID=3154281 RepID=UPI0033B069EC
MDRPAPAPVGFLTPHARLVLALARGPARTVPQLAADCRTSERTVRRIIADLVGGGFLTREGAGQRVRHGLRHDAATWHPFEGRLSVRTLLLLAAVDREEENA